MTARELSRAGKHVFILEARDRIGGRIYLLPEKDFGYPAQGGAEFVHGAAPISREILEKAGATFKHPTEWWNVNDGEPRVNERVSVHDEMLESKLRELKEDMTIKDFFDRYFPEEQYAALREQMFLRTEGYDAADPAKASTFGLRDELFDEGGWHQNNLKEGYGLLLDALKMDLDEKSVQVLFEKEVTTIDTSSSRVKVTCKSGSVFEASQVVLTVPLPILQELTFVPDLPTKKEAAAKIGFGPVIKLLFRFKTKWWKDAREKNFDRMFFMFSHEEIPTWWTQYPEPDLTLTGWLAGPKAAALSSYSEEDLVEKGLHSLSNIFKIDIDELKKQLLVACAVNWAADKYARGAYSYVTPGSAKAIEELLEPVEGKLFFAGEGVYQGETGGTVEAALASGKAAAELLLSSTA